MLHLLPLHRFAALVALAIGTVFATLGSSELFAKDQASASPPKNFRKLAPGVETTILPKYDPEDTVTRHDVAGIQALGNQLNWTPETQASSETLKVLTKDIPFRRDCWYLEFTFKPLRMMYVDLPRADGKMERKLIWYLVYRVKNVGGHSHPVKNEDGTWGTKPIDDVSVRFFPQFVLESKDFNKEYLDRVLPLAVEEIQQREDPHRKLLDSVEMGSQPIPLSTADEDNSVWGVATWVDVDPRIDLFSIYVKGLTNAYRFEDTPADLKPGDRPGKGRKYTQKTLKLNFWRPGDEYFESEKEIYVGIPKGIQPADAKGAVDHEWVFR